ncbi:MAG: hypothetical protein QM776_16560 [Rhodocyclaceae bacterium]
MNIRGFIKRSLSYACTAGAAVFFLSGCAVNMPVPASQKLVTENPMNKVAVLGDARVVWPRMFGREPVLGLEASKETLIAVLPLVKQELGALGYEVSYVQSVAVGFQNPRYNEHWVFPAKGELKVDPADKKDQASSSAASAAVDTGSFGDPYQAKDGKPVFVYPKFGLDSPLGTATRKVFESFDNSANQSNFVIPSDTLELLRNETGSDTLCLARVSGERFTAARKAGATAMNMLTIFVGVVVIPPSDASRVQLSCFEASSGSFLWSGWAVTGDPEKPNAGHLKLVLGNFPVRGRTLSPQCEADKVKSLQLNCKTREADKPNTPSGTASASLK